MSSGDARTAVCPAHNKSFEILFSRYPVGGPTMGSWPASSIQPAGAAPTYMSMPPQPNGTPNPYGLAPSAPPQSSADVYAARLNSAYGAPPVMQCAKHPGIQAVARCNSCGAAVCATCDFAYPGGIHMCPACVSNPKPQVSSKRKGMMWWSIGLGIWSVVAMITFFLLLMGAAQSPGSRNRDSEAMAAAASFLAFIPGIIGLALGLSCFDKRLKTPGTVWIGVATNGIVVLIWGVLIVIGMMK